MATTTSKIEICINKDVNNIIRAKQMDSKSRFLQIALMEDDGTPYDLTGHTAMFNARKSDGNYVFNDCEMTDPANGIITVELTDQTLAIGNSLVVADICVFNADGKEVLTTRTFDIIVQTTMRNNNAVESSNEYGAVVTLFQDVWDLRVYIRSIGHYFDDVPKGEKPASAVSLWGAFNQLYSWTKKQSTAALVDAVDEMLARIGAKNPSTGGKDTLFNYLALLYTSIATKKIIANDSVVRSVQRGSTGASTETTASKIITISPVNTSKSIVILTGESFSSDNIYRGGFANGVALTSSNTLTVYPRYSNNGYQYDSFIWQVIEFY